MLKKWKKQVLYRFRTQTFRYAEISQDSSTKLRHTVWSFVPLQRKTQYLRQNLVAKALWHKKSPNLPKAVSQSLRIPLWHLKSPDLPKATSQSPEKKCRFQRREPAYSPRIRLRRILELLCLCREKRSFFDKPRLQRRQKRKPADYPRILLCRILALLCLCREKRSIFGKT